MNSNNLSFRKVKKDPADISAVVGIYNSNKDFLIHHLGKEKVTSSFISHELQEMEEHGFSSNLIIEAGSPIGVIDYMLQDDGYVYLSMLMLASSVQKSGKGKAIYKCFEEKMIASGAKTIRIDVVDDHEPNVIPFWEKQGFSSKRRDVLTWGDKTSSVAVMEKKMSHISEAKISDHERGATFENDGLFIKEQSLQTEKGSVIYWKSDNWKKDADTIFFLHGLTADHTMFDRQTPYFEKEYNVIVWDAPGHAQSRPFKDFDYADVAEYINSILDECDVKRVFLAGQSLGGMHAQAFIKRYPDRAKGLISIDSTPYGFDYYSKFDIWILKQVEWMFNLYPLRAMKKAMSKQVSVTQEAYDNMMESLLPYGKKEICHLVGMSYAGFLEDNCNLEIPCPVLLILGEKDKTGKVMQYNKAWAEKTGYPLKIVKDAAHNVNVDRPDEVNAYIREFMEGVNASQLSI